MLVAQILDETDLLQQAFIERLEEERNNPIIEASEIEQLETSFGTYYELARGTTLRLVNQETGEHLRDNIWLFSGSGFAELDGQRVYRADVGGLVEGIVDTADRGDVVVVIDDGSGPAADHEHGTPNTEHRTPNTEH